MTSSEMKTEFEVLFNNILSNAAPGYDDYEISVLLTRAQEELVKNRIYAEGNSREVGIDGSSKRQYELNKLIVVDTFSNVNPSSLLAEIGDDIYFMFPNDAIAILNEALVANQGGKKITVVPLSSDEYDRLMMKPLKTPPRGIAWKYTVGMADVTPSYSVIGMVLSYPDKTEGIQYDYVCRYIRKPVPIITTDLHVAFGNTISIDGDYQVQNCELPETMHREIVQRAVEIAKNSWEGTLTTTVQLGDRSE